MKVKSVKLREAHKAAIGGGASFCSAAWDHHADHLVTASSSDPTISIHDPTLPSAAPKILRHHRDGVTAIALSPNSTCLASGSVDHSVKLYKFPSGEFETNITRFTLPIRVLAFNRSGTMLAAAGDDEGIKLINTIDGSIARVLKAHKGPVTGLGFDPNGEYLASIDSIGTLIFWELNSGCTIHTLKGVAPDIGLDLSVMNVLCWSPDGETLAAPGLRNEVVMYDRDTAEKVYSLKGDHTQPICFLAWSPNGKYMATAGLDKQVLIWDVVKKQDIDRQKFSERISCLAWKPKGNALAVIDVTGKYGIWESVIPSSMKSPTEDIPNPNSKPGLLFFEEEEERDEPDVSGSLSDLGEDSLDEFEHTSRKRLRKRSELEHEFDDDDETNELSLLPKVESRKKPHHVPKSNKEKGNEGHRSIVTSSKSKMQEAFQPGATPKEPGKRHFLCYNLLGSITSMDHDGYSHIETDFHDTSRGTRVPSMNDHFGFTMASLNEKGCVFANLCKGDNNMSTLMYRPFSSWANNSEWSMRFEGEEVKVVALGTPWVAAITSLNFLRIFTEGGLQRHIICLDGPVVTASGFKNELALVTHASDSLPSNDQMLEFRVFNVLSETITLRGRLPISPGSHLTWFGFTEEGQLCSYDSKGFLRVFTEQFGGSWLPLFSPSKEKKAENYWVVGLNSSKLFSVVCKSPEIYPQVMPKPVLTLLDLSFPLASSDLGADALENEFMLNNIQLSQLNKKIKELSESGLDTTLLEDEAFTAEAAQDKCILRLIASCCNGDKLTRATELVKLLSLEKSVRGAIKLVTVLKLPNLAERFNSILEERLISESKESPSQTTDSCTTLNGNLAFNGTSVSAKRSGTFETDNEIALPKLSAPYFAKKAKLLGAKAETSKSDTDRSENIDGNGRVEQEIVANIVEKDSNSHRIQQPNRPFNPFSKPLNGQEKKAEEGEQVLPSNRPSNPFLKSSVK